MAAMALILLAPVVFSAELLTLNNNPFARPEILKVKPPVHARVLVPVAPQKKTELVLTATMVSENVPLVIVNGELLGIGENIGKMKLISVLEGEAIFVQGGEKYSFMIDAPAQK
jgi:hypothetical protein